MILQTVRAAWRAYYCLVNGHSTPRRGPGVFQGVAQDRALVFVHPLSCPMCGKSQGTVTTFER